MVAYSNIVVAGGGIIGNSISYYLAKRHSVSCTVIDPVGIAPAASGKAGGFLARDWSDGSPVQELQRRSFDLHAEQAEHLGADKIDYRRLTCIAVACDDRGGGKPSGKKLEGVEWADLGAIGSRVLGTESTIAQVHPRKLCNAMWNYSQESVGSKLIIGKVTEAITSDDGSICGVKLEDGTTIEADALVVACGPWTDAARDWFGSEAGSKIPRMSGVKYHSILIPSPRVLTQAVFFQGHGDPEVYPRPDGDAYITGFPDPSTIVTESPGKEEVRTEAVSRLIDATKKTSSELGDIPPHTEQACYLPTTNEGVPVIGEVPGVRGAFVASGHGCWGILNGPATGEAVAEILVEGKAKHLDLRLLGVDTISKVKMSGRGRQTDSIVRANEKEDTSSPPQEFQHEAIRWEGGVSVVV